MTQRNHADDCLCCTQVLQTQVLQAEQDRAVQGAAEAGKGLNPKACPYTDAHS